MVGRETVHFSEAHSIVNLIERGANIAWAMKSIRVAEGIAPREMPGKALRWRRE
jgi:hypothetical protein